MSDYVPYLSSINSANSPRKVAVFSLHAHCVISKYLLGQAASAHALWIPDIQDGVYLPVVSISTLREHLGPLLPCALLQDVQLMIPRLDD